MKKIIHFEIPTGDRSIRNDFKISAETLGKFVRLIQEKLGEDWVVITSPMKPSLTEDMEHFYNFELKQLSKEELLDMINE